MLSSWSLSLWLYSVGGSSVAGQFGRQVLPGAPPEKARQAQEAALRAFYEVHNRERLPHVAHLVRTHGFFLCGELLAKYANSSVR